jgi:hypothetical protein
MPVIDRSEEIDIDIDVPNEEQKPEKKTESDPIFQEMEEEVENEEVDSEPNLEPESDFQLKFRSDREKDYYSTLNEEEKEAWAGGWRGKMFKGLNKDGTPKPYKTAAEFLSFQKQHTPVLNERNRKLAAEKSAVEKELSELRKQMNVILNVQKVAYEEKTQNRSQSLDEAEEAAILEGDVAKVRAIQKQRLDFEKSKISFEEPEVEQPRNQISRDDKTIIDDWTADNVWFHQDRVMQAAATARFGELSERIPLQERLEMVSEEIRERFGDKLGISKAPRVESGQRGVQVGKKHHSYSELPADVRKACDFMAKKHNFTKEQVAKMQQEALKEYFN